MTNRLPAIAAIAASLGLLVAPAFAAPVTVTLSGTTAEGGPAAASGDFTAQIVFDDAASDSRRDETDATEFFGAILSFVLTVGGETVTYEMADAADDLRNFTEQTADGLSLTGNLGGTEDGQDALAGTLFGAEALGANFGFTATGTGLLFDDQDALLSGVLTEALASGDFTDLALTLDLADFGGIAFVIETIGFSGESADAVPLPGAALLLITGAGGIVGLRRSQRRR